MKIQICLRICIPLARMRHPLNDIRELVWEKKIFKNVQFLRSEYWLKLYYKVAESQCLHFTKRMSFSLVFQCSLFETSTDHLPG